MCGSMLLRLSTLAAVIRLILVVWRRCVSIRSIGSRRSSWRGFLLVIWQLSLLWLLLLWFIAHAAGPTGIVVVVVLLITRCC